MGMGTNDPANTVTGGVQYGIDMLGQSGARVQHRHLIITQQIRVGAWPCHHARIGCDESPNPAVQPKRNSVFKHRLRPYY